MKIKEGVEAEAILMLMGGKIFVIKKYLESWHFVKIF